VRYKFNVNGKATKMTTGWAIFIVGMAALLIASPGFRLVAAAIAKFALMLAIAASTFAALWLAIMVPGLLPAIGFVVILASMVVLAARAIENKDPASIAVALFFNTPFALLIAFITFPNAHGWYAIAAVIAVLATSSALAWLIAATRLFKKPQPQPSPQPTQPTSPSPNPIHNAKNQTINSWWRPA
jgi:hypothetical protein